MFIFSIIGRLLYGSDFDQIMQKAPEIDVKDRRKILIITIKLIGYKK